MPDSTIARPRRRVRGLRAFAIAALGLAAALPAAHAGCKYKRLGSIPLTWRGLVPTVEARLNGTPVKALVDTGGEAIIVSEKLADELHLHQRWTGQLWHGVGGESRVYDARVKQLVVGGFVWDDANVVVASDLAPSTPQVVLGASFLLQHDMDLVFSFAERISVLVNGAMFVDGAPDEVARDPRVKAVYLGEELDA